MKLLITGICGFTGSALAESLRAEISGLTIYGIDNLMRPGSETNRARLRASGVHFFHGDIRCASDWEALPAVDWVIDAAANPSVLAGINGGSRQLLEHNLASMIHVLEYCKQHCAGLIVLSSSRVYSIPALVNLPLREEARAFALDTSSTALPHGVSANGIGVEFSTQAPVSLYGSTKLAGEAIALEYGEAFDFPVWINRCGVLAGAGQFGTPDQGIFAFWINAHLRRRPPLRFIGFDGGGKQVRDAFHPQDLSRLLAAQMRDAGKRGQRVYTAGGGPANAMSLRQLHDWCDAHFGQSAPVACDLRPRPFDIPWVIMDNADATRDFQWAPAIGIGENLSGIAAHAGQHPDWLERSGVAL